MITAPLIAPSKVQMGVRHSEDARGKKVYSGSKMSNQAGSTQTAIKANRKQAQK
jgi:hypothetical protein